MAATILGASALVPQGADDQTDDLVVGPQQAIGLNPVDHLDELGLNRSRSLAVGAE